jgi:hypothetical protein
MIQVPSRPHLLVGPGLPLGTAPAGRAPGSLGARATSAPPMAVCKVCTNHRGRRQVTVSGELLQLHTRAARAATTRRLPHFARCCAQRRTGYAQRDRKGSAIKCMLGERETRAALLDPNLTKKTSAEGFFVKFGTERF